MIDLRELTGKAVQAAQEAGALIRSYQNDEVKVLHKDGRESIEEIDWDPAMGSNGQAMKSSLLARGMSVDSVTLIKE